MKHQGLTGFVLLFAISLLEASQEHWFTAALAFAMGIFIVAMDRPAASHASKHGHPSPR